MKKIKIFLTSSNELIADRLEFEREIYRKCFAFVCEDISKGEKILDCFF